MSRIARVAAAWFGIASAAAHAQVAQLTPVDWYRMGDNDGVAVGQQLGTTSDLVGAKPLSINGNALVTSDVAASASSSVASARSLQFTTRNSDYAVTSLLTSAALDNFGLEAWVKPLSSSATDQVVAYNGSFGSDGFGIVLKADNKYYGQFGATTFGGAAASIGTWAHVAIVRNNGSAQLYLNGAAVGAAILTTPATPTIGFSIGNGLPAAISGLHGLVDEVRFFTLSSGNFFTAQLLNAATLVTSTADTGTGSLRFAVGSGLTGRTIVISATGTITLTSFLTVSSVNIFGPGAGNLSISGGNTQRVLWADGRVGSRLLLTDLSINNGAAKGGVGGVGFKMGGGGMGAGGGLFINQGDVVLLRVNLGGNRAIGGNGGSSPFPVGGAGGGGGLGGAGGPAPANAGAGGGGGWQGAGGGDSGGRSDDLAAGGGGGYLGAGGDGGSFSGGGGGGYNAGQNGVGAVGGQGATGVGGNGAGPTGNGGDGQIFGGGGGAPQGTGGSGGTYAGGGGGFRGGAGGDFGGSGGSSIESGAVGAPAGFGGGSGGSIGEPAGNAGFGGGCGHGASAGCVPGAFGGLSPATGTAGGGAALGGAIFVRASNGASLSWNEGSADSGDLTPGFYAQASGSALFLLGGTTTLNSTNPQTIAGSIGGWSGDPPNITKLGTGPLILAGGGSDLGVIDANKGELRINSAVGLAAGKVLNVKDTATLSGMSGSVNGAVTLFNGGTISPGDPTSAGGVGTLTLGDLTWTGGGVISLQLGQDDGSTSDHLVLNGNLTKAGSGTWNFQFTDGTGAQICGTAYTLIQYAGTTNFTAADFSYSYNGSTSLAASSGISVGANKVQFNALCNNNQAITNFSATPANPPYVNGGTFGVSATGGGSGNPIVFGSNTPSVCTLSGATVTMLSRGTCTLTASQAGSTSYNPAPTVLLTLHFQQYTVNASTQSAFGTIIPPMQTVDYDATATFSAMPLAGYAAVVQGDTCTVTKGSGNVWTASHITADCSVTATFTDRIFAANFE